MEINDLPENIKSKIEVTIPGHWLWVGAVSDRERAHRQGVVRFNGKMHKICRVILHLDGKLDLDSKLQANHKRECSLDLCCNPDHLYAGTQQENIVDRDIMGHNRYAMKTTCPKGHELSTSPTTGHRYCQICKNERRNIWRKNRKENNK